MIDEGRTISPDMQKKILDALQPKISEPCARCKSNDISLMDGYIAMPISPSPLQVIIGKKVIPCVAVICRNCGNIDLHSLIAIGLTEDELNSK